MNDLIKYADLKEIVLSSTEFDGIGNTEIVLQLFSKVILHLDIGKKLGFSLRFVGFCRFIGLFILSKSDLGCRLKTYTNLEQISDFDPQILRAYLDMMVKLGLCSKKANSYALESKYHESLACNHKELSLAIDIKDWRGVIKSVEKSQNYSDLRSDFLFVYLIICCRTGEPVELEVSSSWGVNSFWKNASGGNALYYEVIKASTLLNLMKSDLVNKIPFNNSDEYFFSGLGRMAFSAFTSKNFKNVLQQLNENNPINCVLDIGSGFGDYIDLINRNFNINEIHGVERQEAAYNKLINRFDNDENVIIHCKDIMDLNLGTKVDLISLIYVLFYFSTEQQIKLFKSLASMMSNHGTIVVGQYYPDIEVIRKKLAIVNGDYGVLKKVDMYFANKVLYSEVMLNDCVDIFDSAERWNSFNDVLETAGLKVDSITNADSYYYSMFVVIKKR